MMSEGVYSPMLMVCVTGLFGWLLVNGFRFGTMECGYFGLHLSGNRQSEPGKFWAATALLAIPFCLGIIGTAAMVLWPHGIGS
ncbi:hypothetical protein [uncultured Sphingomonas sp.]|mgnify:CR=1 FL=1|uniref:hypothetical protein n=1 Tax=uncultured Sphingomonas sp. TaxID=158754 RepID=UPI0026047F05|nr:hypothetical protein [uncultured Sphingomonas sp.]